MIAGAGTAGEHLENGGGNGSNDNAADGDSQHELNQGKTTLTVL